MNKQPTSRICMTGCFRLTEEYASPGQKFRVLSVEATERRDAESTRCSFCEKEQVWMRYIKYMSDKFQSYAREERVETNKAKSDDQRIYHFLEEIKDVAAANALEALLSAFKDNTVKDLMWRMGENPGNED